MKRLLLSFLFLMCLVYSSWAQGLYDEPKRSKTTESWGDIVVPDKTVFGVRFVLDNARLGGITYEERIEIDPDVKTEFDDMVVRCISAANKFFQESITRAGTFRFSPKYEGKDYTVTYYIKSVSDYGYTIADVVISANGKIATILNLKGKGGKYGSFTNLMGDGFQSLGEELADCIDRAVYRKMIKLAENN